MTTADRPLASVVVPTHDAAPVVAGALDSLRRQTMAPALEVIVIDDGSTDGTWRVVSEWIAAHPDLDVRLLRRERRGGPNAARNDGIRAARSPLVLMCDGDDIAHEQWAERLVDALDQHPRVNVMVGGHCVELSDDGRLTDRVLYGTMRWGSIDYALGGNCGLRRDLALAVGGFDEQTTAGGTEVDFAVRVHHQFGLNIVDVPDALIGYRLPSRTWGRFRRSLRKARGVAYLRLRHGGSAGCPSSRDLMATPWRVLGRTMHAVVRRRPTEVDLATAIARALGSLWWNAVFLVQRPQPLLGLTSITPHNELASKRRSEASP